MSDYIQNLFAVRIGGKNFGKETVLYKFEKIKRARRAAEAEEELTLEQAAQRALELTRNGYAASAAAKAAAQGTPYSKSEVYKQLLALQAD